MMKETYQVEEVQLSYNPKFNAVDRPKVSQSEQAYKIFIQQWDLGKIQLIEQFKVILLNTNNRVLGLAHISEGGVNSAVVDPRVIFSIALKANASSVILAHNHPSGSLQPSQADILHTKKLVEAGKLLEIAVHDHLIVTTGGYISLKDECLI